MLLHSATSSATSTEVTECIFPSHMWYNQDQVHMFTELHVSPGIPFTIIDGFGTPEDSFTTQRQVLAVSSIIAIQNSSLELRRYEDTNLFEIFFNYSAITDFELSIHFAASLFSSTTMLRYLLSFYFYAPMLNIVYSISKC
jgi:hypothetical protein